MRAVLAAYDHRVLIVAAIVVSVLIGFLPGGWLRTMLIALLFMVPPVFVLILANTYSTGITFEFGSWMMFLPIAPTVLALWAVVSLLPYKLTVRLRQIQAGVQG